MVMQAHLFLSPHFDDAVGACSGAIQRLRAAGQTVRVITLFTTLAQPLSDFARRLHADWGLDDPMPSRLAENERACGILGCQPETLNFPDAIYRRSKTGVPLYDTFDALKAEPAADDAGLAERIAAAIEARYGKDTSTLYCPLSVGNHVDHVVTRRSGEILRARGWNVVFYHDFFYDSFAEPTRFDAADRQFSTGTLRLTRNELRMAETAIAAYDSQIAPLFGSAKGLKLYCLKHRRSETYYFPSPEARDAFLAALPAPGGARAEQMGFLSSQLDRVFTRLFA